MVLYSALCLDGTPACLCGQAYVVCLAGDRQSNGPALDAEEPGLLMDCLAS